MTQTIHIHSAAAPVANTPAPVVAPDHAHEILDLVDLLTESLVGHIKNPTVKALALTATQLIENLIVNHVKL